MVTAELWQWLVYVKGSCGCQCPHLASVLHPDPAGTSPPPWVHLSAPGGGSEGFGRGKEKSPIARAGRQLAWCEAEGRAAWRKRWHCVGLGQSLSCGASNFWRDPTLGTSLSGHR